MKIGNLDGRAVIMDGGRAVDIAEASGNLFGPDPGALFDRWDQFTSWASEKTGLAGESFDVTRLRAPSPRPSQVFGIGTNYRRHVEEVGWPVPEVPLVFTKFPSSITGPSGEIELSGTSVDWEVELVVIVGKIARRVSSSDAWDYVAGVTIGQDTSDRDTQQQPKSMPQFSLGKSYPGYGATGPVLVTVDEFEDSNDIEISCRLNDELVQKSSSSDLIFSVPALIEYLSGIVTLRPGDLIFTGTPSGVGAYMNPPRFLRQGDTITSWASGIGEMEHTYIDVAE